MHKTVVKNPVHLVHRVNGVVHTFKGLEQVINNWPFLKKMDIGAKFKIEYTFNEWDKKTRLIRDYNRNDTRYHYRLIYPPTHHEYTLRDSFGSYIAPNIVQEEYSRRNHHTPYWYRWNSWRKKSGGHVCRRLKTTNERRQVQAWEGEEFAPKVRARRNLRNLPNTWDDYMISSYDNRNWKEFRKTQWKPIK